MRGLLAVWGSRLRLFLGLCFLVVPGAAGADELNAGDTSWMLTATALVLL